MRNRSNGRRFAALLKAYGVTPKALSVELGVSRGIVSHWSLGKRRPSEEHITAIADVLGCGESDVAYCFVDGKG